MSSYFFKSIVEELAKTTNFLIVLLPKQTHSNAAMFFSTSLDFLPTTPPPARWHLFSFHRVVVTFICIFECNAKNEKF